MDTDGDPAGAVRAALDLDAALHADPGVRALGLGPEWAGQRLTGASSVRRSSGTGELAEEIRTVELVHGRLSAGPLLQVSTRSLSVQYPPAGLDALIHDLPGAEARGTSELLVDGQPVSFEMGWDGFAEVAVADLDDCTVAVRARNWPPLEGLELVTITDLAPYLAGRQAAVLNPELR